RGVGAGVEPAAGLVEEPLELDQEVVGVAAAARDQVADQLVGVVAGEAPAPDRVVDDLLEPVARQGHAAVERVAEGLDALVRPGRRAARPAGAGTAGFPRHLSSCASGLSANDY